MMVGQIESQRSSSPSVVGLLAVSAAAKQNPTTGATKPKRLDQVRQAIRARHYSYRTEQMYIAWIKRYIFFHHVRHPAETRNEMTVRDGKGAKDRVTMLPESLKATLQEHLGKVKAIHEQDVRDGWGRVQMPDALPIADCRLWIANVPRSSIRNPQSTIGRSAWCRSCWNIRM
jgi:hypothetical protein